MILREDTISSIISDVIRVPQKMGGIEYDADRVEPTKRKALMRQAKEGNTEAIEILKTEYGLTMWISEGVRIF